MRDTLWTRNFTLITCATGLGAVGGIASSFALSFLVFDETGSTLASALLIAMLGFAAACALVALLAKALAQLVRRAAAIKSENDLTI